MTAICTSLGPVDMVRDPHTPEPHTPDFNTPDFNTPVPTATPNPAGSTR
jgi:hypothetical protein